MGAAGSVESLKPADASDVRNSGSLAYARNEIVHLRANLGKYALQAGFTGEVVYDGSDLCLGSSDSEDFDRCVSEISHIRQCLRLSTQGARRATRSVITNIPANLIEHEKKCRSESIVEDSSASNSSDSDGEEIKIERKSRK